jgi:hypothetical protein
MDICGMPNLTDIDVNLWLSRLTNRIVLDKPYICGHNLLERILLNISQNTWVMLSSRIWGDVFSYDIHNNKRNTFVDYALSLASISTLASIKLCDLEHL